VIKRSTWRQHEMYRDEAESVWFVINIGILRRLGSVTAQCYANVKVPVLNTAKHKVHLSTKCAVIRRVLAACIKRLALGKTYFMDLKGRENKPKRTVRPCQSGIFQRCRGYSLCV